MLRKGIRVLIVDPDLDYWENIKKKPDWMINFDICFTRNQMNKLLENNLYSMILTNLDFYKEDLIENRYCRARKKFDGPILFLDANADVNKRIEWLKMGIYDVWSKNMDYQELQLKIIRVCELEINQYTYEIDCYTINESCQQIWMKDKKLKLAPIPYKLLLYLLNNPNTDLSRELLLRQVWNYNVDAGNRVVDKNINTIRLCTNDKRIKSVYGYGYRFELNPGDDG